MIGESTTKVIVIFNRQWQKLFDQTGKQHYEREVWASFDTCPVCGQLIHLMDSLGKKAHIVLCANENPPAG